MHRGTSIFKSKCLCGISEPFLGGIAGFIDTEWTVVQKLLRTLLLTIQVFTCYIHQCINE